MITISKYIQYIHLTAESTKCFRLLAYVAILCLTTQMKVVAQSHEMGIMAGGGLYKGDLIAFPDPSYYRPAVGLLYRYTPRKAGVLRTHLLYTQVAGSGEARGFSNRYLSEIQKNPFSTSILELAALGEYNFFDYRHERYRRWSPYLTGGVAVALLFKNDEDAKEADQPKGNTVHFVVPFGIGAKYILSKRFNVGFEVLTHKTFTDYIDNVSERDPGTQWQRGNPNTDDWYLFTGFMLTYTIYNVPCPFFSN